jgi:hypothetical protein
MAAGMTDADTIAAIGEQLGAKFVMAGSITALGNQNILVVSIVRIETIQQVAGDFLTYGNISELRPKVSAMIKNLLPLLNVDSSEMQKLAILPVQLRSGAGARDADTLAQILAIYLLREQNYAIYPRTASLEQVQQEFNTQLSGVTADREAARLGYGVNPEYVLSVVSRKLGDLNMFNAAIIDLKAGTQYLGLSEQYGTMDDGINAMGVIAKTLSGGEVSNIERQRREQSISESASAAKRSEEERIAAEKRDKFLRESGIIFGIQGGLSYTFNLDEQIFGETKPTEDTVSSTGGNVGPVIALRLGKYFAIQSGANVNINLKGPSKLKYTYLQVPILVRGDWPLPLVGDMGFGVFGGLAFNIPLIASSDALGSQTATMTIPTGGIVGIEFSLLHWGDLSLYADMHYTFDFGETTVKLDDGHAGKFYRSSLDIIFGVKYFIPLRR